MRAVNHVYGGYVPDKHACTAPCPKPPLYCSLYHPHIILPVLPPHCFAFTCPYQLALPRYRSHTILPIPPPYCFAPVLPLQVLTNRYCSHTVLLIPLQYCLTPVLPLQVLTNRYRPGTVLPPCHPYKPLPTSTTPVPFCPRVTLTNWYCPSPTPILPTITNQ